MIRNEILEVGQTVLLYRSGEWRGKTQGLGTLFECYDKNSFEERWTVVLDNGHKASWSMLRTDKELTSETFHPIYVHIAENDDEIPF